MKKYVRVAFLSRTLSLCYGNSILRSVAVAMERILQSRLWLCCFAVASLLLRCCLLLVARCLLLVGDACSLLLMGAPSRFLAIGRCARTILVGGSGAVAACR